MSALIRQQAGRSRPAADFGQLSPTVAALCRCVGLARPTHYRLRRRSEKPVDRDREARGSVVRVCQEWMAYGHRRVTAQLGREGTPVGRERVRRLMREEGLTLKPKRRWVRTTQSDHGLAVWPNLAKDGH
jgi:putative transposase